MRWDTRSEMHTVRAALACFVLSELALFIALTLTAGPRLPARVASHFNAAGLPDGWMSRSNYLWSMAGLGLGLALFMIGIFYLIRFLPLSSINLPRRDYWLAPERRAATLDRIFRAGIYLATLEALFVLGVHLLVVEANASRPVRLSSAIWMLGGAFLVAIGAWIYLFMRRFMRG